MSKKLRLQSQFFLILVFASILSSTTLSQDEPKLVVRADDMGYTHAGNQAIIECYKNGIVRSVEVIVPSPWFLEAVKLLKENPEIDVGVHLAVTSEWENIKWRPLTESPSLRDSNGYFYPFVFPNKNYPGQSISEHQWNIKDLEKEFRAQIEMLKKHVPGVSHISTHMFCAGLSNEVAEMVKRLASEYNLLPETDYKMNPMNMGFGSDTRTTDEKIENFVSWLKNMEPGKSYVFIDHPGFNNNEMQGLYHIGYEHVAEDRQDVTNVLTSEKVKQTIKERKIKLIKISEKK